MAESNKDDIDEASANPEDSEDLPNRPSLRNERDVAEGSNAPKEPKTTCKLVFITTHR